MLFISCQTVDDLLETSLTNEEIVEGLKSALTVGTDTSVSVLSAVDGYYRDQVVKILLPPEAQVIADNVSRLGSVGDALVEEALLAINRAAEDAATEATPIFVDAIVNIDIVDGLAILNGADNAATEYLETNTYSDLETAFNPKIGASLNKDLVGNTSAEDAYSALLDAYNTASLNGVLFDKVETNTLTEHTTEKALDGLFLKVAVEEGKIRNDISHRVNDILKKVFGEQ